MYIQKNRCEKSRAAPHQLQSRAGPRRLDIFKLVTWVVTFALLWGAVFGIVYYLVHLLYPDA